MLIKTIAVMAFMSTACAKAQLQTAWRICSSLSAGERMRESQVFLGLLKIWLDAKCCFVMGDGLVVLTCPNEEIRQLLMRDLELRIHGEAMLVTCPCLAQ